MCNPPLELAIVVACPKTTTSFPSATTKTDHFIRHSCQAGHDATLRHISNYVQIGSCPRDSRSSAHALTPNAECRMRIQPGDRGKSNCREAFLGNADCRTWGDQCGSGSVGALARKREPIYESSVCFRRCCERSDRLAAANGRWSRVRDRHPERLDPRCGWDGGGERRPAAGRPGSGFRQPGYFSAIQRHPVYPGRALRVEGYPTVTRHGFLDPEENFSVTSCAPKDL